jgi:RHS repeat-associated protein
VTHGGGTANVALNQQQNGGGWMPLGSWSFTPGSGHKVTLAASGDGTTIADAMLFVGAGAQPANLLYVHADHLGSPQKLTDASQTTVWDGVFDPFGEEVVITGLAAMQMRFPGQYADEETGFSYNYFRNYDPNLGRYIQSDPIGLLGGINLYSYTDGNPVTRIDRRGLAIETVWDAANVAIDVASLGYNLDQGNYGEATLDALSLILDGAATCIPFLPGGVGALRHTDEVLDLISGSKKGDKLPDDVPTGGGAGSASNNADVHGNNLNTQRPAEGYSLRDRDTGEVLKYGDTIQGKKRYSQKYLERVNGEMVFEAKGTKREMHYWQNRKIREYKECHGGCRPPLNKSDW